MRRCPLVAVIAAITLSACDDPAEPEELLPFAAVSAGAEHTCAIGEAGAVYCWGNGSTSQLGTGEYGVTVRPDRVELTPAAQSIDAGFRHTCAITTDQQVFCWGWNLRGQLGNASTIDQGLPIPIESGLRFQQVSSGWFHTCAITVAADAYCWGANGQGQLGDGTTTDRLSPTRVNGALKFASISAGGFHSCGVTTAGALYCWGLNHEGQLGTGDVASVSRPTRSATEVSYAVVSGGYSHSCALDANGRPWCWGSNAHGEMGVGFESPQSVPGSMAPAEVLNVDNGFVGIEAGLEFTCVVSADGRGWCWGFGLDGRLGTGAFRSWAVRQPVASVDDFARITTGKASHACGITRVGAIVCWGRGEAGQLGNPETTLSPVPVRVPGVS